MTPGCLFDGVEIIAAGGRGAIQATAYAVSAAKESR